MTADSVLHVSVVIPVYRGERTLERVVGELLALTEPTPVDGMTYRIDEIVLVHDGAMDDSARVMQHLALAHPCTRVIWLTRNFGQHAATLAGMAATTAPWVATIDEDGQQDPRDIGALLAGAIKADLPLAYAAPVNASGHGLFRNALSGIVHWLFIHPLGNRHIGVFNSFRVIDGEIARSLAAYCSHSVFLDAALSWVVHGAVHVPVRLREQETRPSGYSLRSLSNHFLRLLITTGTRPLRFIASLGLLSILVAVGLTAYAIWVKFFSQTQPVSAQGWTSLVIVISFFSGCILFALGVIAEYLAVALGIVMGKPLYLVSSRPRSRR
ncbi:MAG: hypothetical protein G01um101425_104 [Candidatus Peregrinibacteria bacterium Gr01-1014_25]|nr:MAG: hypothetical protein G01um101425_104 [Candidatus Peregrinibacteria bacterium Gr01-1014_25]